MTKMLDLLGQTFGRLTVLKSLGTDKHSKSVWLCSCSCGNKTKVSGGQLVSGGTKSCGCQKRERIIKQSTKHGNAKRKNQSPEYRAWCSLKSRCFNPAAINYHSYGGRGIKVCDRWLHSFENFLADMGNKPSKHHTIDRINNDGDYSPDNCRWTTKFEQDANKSNNLLITCNGETHPAFVWAKLTGINRQTIISRINQLNWSAEKALTTPVKSRKSRRI
jgi:hypothetical protein